ncbi:MAG: peroxide stress protein YaaA [Pseudomonadota bacterium]|nr:peroxide stress protein YaaA [Pseudomonadota bacterium]
MLFLLSPAKALDYDTPVADGVPYTQPRFKPQAAELIDVLRQKTPAEVASLMSLSDPLATLNVARYAAYSPRFTAQNARQAALAFNGDVYGGLDARTLTPTQLDWLQDHVCILSGLYGVLRPLDRMQPYRLEMGTRLATAHGRNLYQFWGTRIADDLNQRLRGARAPTVVNLASQEYFKAVDRQALQARVVECVFEEHKAGQYKVISFSAKRARGLMARWAAQHRPATPERLQHFDSEGYAFAPAASTADRLVFRRRLGSH